MSEARVDALLNELAREEPTAPQRGRMMRLALVNGRFDLYNGSAEAHALVDTLADSAIRLTDVLMPACEALSERQRATAELLKRVADGLDIPPEMRDSRGESHWSTWADRVEPESLEHDR